MRKAVRTARSEFYAAVMDRVPVAPITATDRRLLKAAEGAGPAVASPGF